MCGEILTIETVKKIAKMKRLERDKNLAEMQLKAIRKKYIDLSKKVEYLEERNKTLTALEDSIPSWIGNLEKKNAPKPLIEELKYLKNMLAEEKEKLLKNSEEKHEG